MRNKRRKSVTRIPHSQIFKRHMEEESHFAIIAKLLLSKEKRRCRIEKINSDKKLLYFLSEKNKILRQF